MAKVYFNKVEDLICYREDRLAFLLVDLYHSCPILTKYLKQETPGLYRKGKSSPLISKGQIVSLDQEGVFKNCIYEEDSIEYITITFKDILSTSKAIYSKDNEKEIIPSVSSKLRASLFTDTPLVPNIFLIAFTSLVSIVASDIISRDQVVDYQDKLDECLITDKTEDEITELAMNYHYSVQIKQGKRYPIDEERILETVEDIKNTKESIRDQIIQEFITATNNSICKFISEYPCSRYHFDDRDGIFYLERGVDTRIYSWEIAKFEKIEEIEESIGTKLSDIDFTRYSASHDFLK